MRKLILILIIIGSYSCTSFSQENNEMNLEKDSVFICITYFYKNQTGTRMIFMIRDSSNAIKLPIYFDPYKDVSHESFIKLQDEFTRISALSGRKSTILAIEVSIQFKESIIERFIYDNFSQIYELIKIIRQYLGEDVYIPKQFILKE